MDGLSVIREDRCEITDRVTTLPPYSLLQISSILRNEGHDVNLIDANGTNITYDDLKLKIYALDEFDAIIFRFTPTTYMHDMEIAKIVKYRNKRIKTIALCWTLRLFAEKVMVDLKELDVYVIGDYIPTVPKLINALKCTDNLKDVAGIVYRDGNDIIKNGIDDPDYDYNQLPLPAYDLLPSLNNYFTNTKCGMPYTIIYSSKGCPYKCIYCTVAETEWQARSTESILNEIRYLKKEYHLKSLTFFDETFTYNRDRVIEICSKLIDEKINITWYCNTRSNKVDLELLKLMRQAGCKGMSLGIESGSQTILNNAKKGTTVEQNEQAIAAAKKAGIKTYCSFMFGLPGENWDTVKETIDFVKRCRPNGAQFNVVVPYPGTKLFDMAVENKWISGDINWTKLHQHVSTMRTDDLSTEDLEKARKMAYKGLYFNPKWVIMNIAWVMRNMEDFQLAVKYYLKSMKNYVMHGMDHAH
jgi:radical SAM superfamily enzyme YgiQ (UPF0313 family)